VAPARLAKTAIAVLVGLYLAWWVATIGIVQVEEDDNPFLAARAAPDHPRIQIDIAMAYFMARGGRVPEDRREAALEALKRAPLADEPFLLAAVNALAAGRNAEGERLLVEARRRNPRLRMARLLLLDRYLRGHRVKEAVSEVKALGNLIEGASGVLTPALAQMVQDPATAPQLIPLLQGQPALREAVLENMVTSGADEALILRVAGLSGRSTAEAAWKPALLSRLVAGHDIAGAWNLWRTFAGAGGDGAGKGVYDPGFAGLPGPPPFNWELSAGGAGVAERSGGHALRVDYYGRDNGNLANQLLMLKPGRYRLSFQATGDASGEGGRLVWSVACDSAGTRLLQLPIAGVTSAQKRFAGSFAVPASGCTAQWLKLDGAPGDVESAQEATISGLSITSEGGS
jgi:hypothetical protein